ncbi:MAG: hypothetical protein RIE74_02100 [Pseudomonadales bacterium]
MRLPTLNHFGGCPKCHGDAPYLNLRRDHWFYCARDRLAWKIGSNLFSSWRYESEQDWQRNADMLDSGGYTHCEPSVWAWGDVPIRGLLSWAGDWLRHAWWRIAGRRRLLHLRRQSVVAAPDDDLQA